MKPISEHPRELISALLDGELTAAERVEVESHIRACSECRALESDLRRLESARVGEKVPPVPAGLEARIARGIAVAGKDAAHESALASVPRSVRAGSATETRGSRGFGQRWLSPWSLTAAAGIAAAGLLTVVLVREQRSVEPGLPGPALSRTEAELGASAPAATGARESARETKNLDGKHLDVAPRDDAGAADSSREARSDREFEGDTLQGAKKVPPSGARAGEVSAPAPPLSPRSRAAVGPGDSSASVRAPGEPAPAGLPVVAGAPSGPIAAGEGAAEKKEPAESAAGRAGLGVEVEPHGVVGGVVGGVLGGVMGGPPGEEEGQGGKGKAREAVPSKESEPQPVEAVSGRAGERIRIVSYAAAGHKDQTVIVLPAPATGTLPFPVPAIAPGAPKRSSAPAAEELSRASETAAGGGPSAAAQASATDQAAHSKDELLTSNGIMGRTAAVEADWPPADLLRRRTAELASCRNPWLVRTRPMLILIGRESAPAQILSQLAGPFGGRVAPAQTGSNLYFLEVPRAGADGFLRSLGSAGDPSTWEAPPPADYGCAALFVTMRQEPAP